MIHYIYLAWYSCVCISIRMDTDFAIIHTYEYTCIWNSHINSYKLHIGNIRVFNNQNSCHHGTCKLQLWMNDLFVRPGTPYNSFQYQITTSLCSAGRNMLLTCYNAISQRNWSLHMSGSVNMLTSWWRNCHIKISFRYSDFIITLCGNWGITDGRCRRAVSYPNITRPFIFFVLHNCWQLNS